MEVDLLHDGLLSKVLVSIPSSFGIIPQCKDPQELVNRTMSQTLR